LTDDDVPDDNTDVIVKDTDTEKEMAALGEV
jgi:hypothetical protein